MTSAPGGSFLVQTPTGLSAAECEAVRRLALEVEELDGAEPLNEPALLRLSAPAGPTLVHELLRGPDRITDYAQLTRAEPPEVEVLVGPGADRGARAGALIARAEAHTGKDLLLWSRGNSPVGPAALARGYTAIRTMLTMRRPLSRNDADRSIAAPTATVLRPFVPGRDDTAWLEVNAAAFAHHPEQGRMTRTDLDDRVGQDWFDPDGFILALDEGGTLLGYHWTKLHPPVHPGELPVGEVYVLGIAPQAQGRGLGRILLQAGLRHLARGPAREVILYVEQDNPGAVHLYERDGFTVARSDIQLRRPATG